MENESMCLDKQNQELETLARTALTEMDIGKEPSPVSTYPHNLNLKSNNELIEFQDC